MLRMENGIGFTSNSYQLDSYIHKTLRGVARILVEYPDTSLVIEGHTDSTGSDTTNQVLSEKRAESVRSFLLSQGVAAGRAIARGNGERFLYAQITPQKDALVTAASRFKFCHSNSV